MGMPSVIKMNDIVLLRNSQLEMTRKMERRNDTN